MERALAIDEPQVLAPVHGHPQTWQHRVLLRHVGNHRWVALGPGGALEVFELRSRDVLPLQRAGPVPAQARGDCALIPELTEAELVVLRGQALQLAGYMAGHALPAGASQVGAWRVAERDAPDFGQMVPWPEVARAGLVQGAVASLRWGDPMRWLQAVWVPTAEYADWERRVRGGGHSGLGLVAHPRPPKGSADWRVRPTVPGALLQSVSRGQRRPSSMEDWPAASRRSTTDTDGRDPRLTGTAAGWPSPPDPPFGVLPEGVPGPQPASHAVGRSSYPERPSCAQPAAPGQTALPSRAAASGALAASPVAAQGRQHGDWVRMRHRWTVWYGQVQGGLDRRGWVEVAWESDRTGNVVGGPPPQWLRADWVEPCHPAAVVGAMASLACPPQRAAGGEQ